jgi:hypothetical protein
VINGYVIDYLREIARQAVLAKSCDATSYGNFVAEVYDSTVRETSIPSIKRALIDELESAGKQEPGSIS